MGSHRGDGGRAQPARTAAFERAHPRLLLALVAARRPRRPTPRRPPPRELTSGSGLEIVSLTVHDPGGCPRCRRRAERTLRLTVRNRAPPIKAVAAADGARVLLDDAHPRPAWWSSARRDRGHRDALPARHHGDREPPWKVRWPRPPDVAFAATTTQWPWGLASSRSPSPLLWLGSAPSSAAGADAGIRPSNPWGRSRRGQGRLLPGPAHGPVPMGARRRDRPPGDRTGADAEDSPAAEPDPERALIEQVPAPRRGATGEHAPRGRVAQPEPVGGGAPAQPIDAHDPRLAEALVLASKALDDQASEETPPEDPAAPPPDT